MTAFIRGCTSHIQAFRLLARNRSVRRLALAPFLVNLLLFMVGIPLALWAGVSIVDSLFSDSSFWIQALTLLVQVLVVCLIVLASLFLFTLVGTIISGPFLGPLSEKVESYQRERAGLPVSASANRGIVGDVWRGIAYGVGRLLIFVLLYPFYLCHAVHSCCRSLPASRARVHLRRLCSVARFQ